MKARLKRMEYIKDDKKMVIGSEEEMIMQVKL